ncbi:hypothetical protein IMG5_047780 [Ichthyophthirius multifiliis]|uniref:Uncharacterized protein n=1 Tax=Ichthyophthirius multifiliis TaxID=5932 RepID=G0QMD8_ICHMU|nr:hypothetical protein IMG5_047780 [Ichthyophthirius multifiliis]EGR33632.1 hypothetical protein IMG5_047780 [Ichthyophthirius multifiliis]|eukprot:XP_004037618.1 hypothetical protein IMG5_047780 [Ichthyophthirius multifiliis]
MSRQSFKAPGCRMKTGLMEKEEFDKLGFTEESSWENEEAEQKFLFSKILEKKKLAFENSKNNFQQKQKQQQTKLPE